MGVTVTASSWFYYQGNVLLAFASNSFHCDFLCSVPAKHQGSEVLLLLGFCALAKAVSRLLWELYLNWEAFQNEHCFKWYSLQNVKCPKVASKDPSECWRDYCHSPSTGILRGLTKTCRSSLWEPWAAASKTEPFFFLIFFIIAEISWIKQQQQQNKNQNQTHPKPTTITKNHPKNKTNKNPKHKRISG